MTLKGNEVIKYNGFGHIIFAKVVHIDKFRDQYLLSVFFPEEKKAPIRVSGSEQGMDRVIKNYGVTDAKTFFKIGLIFKTYQQSIKTRV